MSLFRRGPSRRDVETALASARGIVEILSLSRANVSAAQALISEGERLLESGDTAQAAEAIERAERIATSLEADYRAAIEARERLKANVDRMQAAQMPVDEEARAIEAIHARASETRELEDRQVPDYAGARSLAEEAARRADEKLESCVQAGDAIFAAEVAVDGASEVFHGGAEGLDMAREVLEKARTEMSSGNYEMAAKDARIAEKLSLDLMDERQKALETLVSVDHLVQGLRSVGVATNSVNQSLELGRSLVNKGRIAEAVDVFNDTAQEAVALGTQYRALLDRLSEASKAIHEMQKEGLPAADAEAAFGRAKAALKAGNYALATSCAEDVHAVVTQQREMRDGLRTWIDEAKKQIEKLHELGLAIINDAEEMVGKAEREFENGDYAATGEDLRIAGLLMKPALNEKLRNGAPVPR